MSVLIHIPTPLRAYTGGQPSVSLQGDTVGQALEQLMTDYPQLKKHLRDANGKLRSFVNIYVGDEDIRSLVSVPVGLPPPFFLLLNKKEA